MADKEVKIKIATDVELGEVQALESNISKLKYQKAVLDIQTNTSRLEEVDSRINTLKAELKTLQGKADVDDSEIKKVETELEALEAEKINIALDIETSKIDAAQSKAEALDDTTIDLTVDNTAALQSVDQIGQGFDRLKQGASEVGQQMGTILEASGKQETNKTFLEMSVGADQAAKSLSTINGIVQDLPGDDTALQGLLSSAAAKNASITADELQGMGVAAADYFSAMSYYGKSATEAQQDMTNYLLAGNTAELERSPILQGHIDKLKEANTPMERSLALQQALKEEGWAGMSQQDTYNNKLETFNGMLERGKYNLGGMFQEGAKWGMDFLMNLDQSTNGLVGMAFALGGLASPITDTLMGIGQIATGLNAIKDTKTFQKLAGECGKLKGHLTSAASSIKGGFTSALQSAGNAAGGLATKLRGGLASALTSLKNTMTGTIIPTLRNLATGLLNAGKNALLAGANAVKSAALWAIEKGAKIASIAVTKGLAIAQGILNAVMSMNPIMLVVIALVALIAALIWAYQNVDWFRQMVDNAWQTLVSFGQQIYTVVAGALQWLGDLFNQFTSQLGLNTNDWMQALLGFILFLPTLPIQVGIALINTIARLLGFKGNFVQTMATTAAQAITNFVTWISQLPGRVGNFLSNVISRVHSFGSSLVSSFVSSASSAVSNFVGQISSLPGQLSNELSNMLSLVNDWAATLPAKFWEAGVNAVKNFLNALGIHSPGTMQTMMLWEVSEMARRVPKEGENLVGNISSLGSDVVDSFQPSLGIDWDDTMNANVDGGAGGSIGASQVNNFYFSDIVVDNEERMQRIVDYVRREIHWNNKTAGRTI